MARPLRGATRGPFAGGMNTTEDLIDQGQSWPSDRKIVFLIHNANRVEWQYVVSFMNVNNLECRTFDVKGCASVLGLCPETIRRLVRRKVLRKIQGLRKVLIPKGEIQRFLSER